MDDDGCEGVEPRFDRSMPRLQASSPLRKDWTAVAGKQPDVAEPMYDMKSPEATLRKGRSFVSFPERRTFR